MSYSVHNFQSGNKLYASQLNQMDSQIASNSSVAAEVGGFDTHLINLYDSNDADIKEGGIYLSSNTWYANASFFETGYIPTTGNSQKLYINSSDTLHVNVFNESKSRISGGTTTSEPDGWQSFTVASQSAKYIRVGLPNASRNTSVITASLVPITEFVIKDSFKSNVLGMILDHTDTGNNLFVSNDSDIEEGGIRLSSSSGRWYDASTMFETGYMKTKGNGEVIYFSGTNSCHVCWYSADKTFQSGSVSTAHSDTIQKVTITTSDARYFRIGMQNAYRYNAFIAVTPTIQYTTSYSIKNEYGEGSSKWYGKKWYAFGTSITDTSYTNEETGSVTGKYVPYLAQMSGMTVVNNGIAGGKWTTNILARIIATDISDADIVTIEGCVNDFAAGSEIGEFGDTTADTIAGAMYQMVNYISTHSNATIVFITESTGKQYTLQDGTTADYRISYKKANGHIQQDYNDAIIANAGYLGVPCVDAGRNSQISYFHPEFIIDQIHHTELGGKQYANAIWDGIKNLSPMVVKV